MKVALYTAELDVYGGTNKQVLRLAEFLKLNNDEVVIYTPIYNSESTYNEFKNINIIYSRKRKLKNNIIQRKLQNFYDQLYLFLKIKDVDIINVHDMYCGFFILLNILFHRHPIVWQINDLDPAFSEGNSKANSVKLRWMKKLFISLIAKRVKKITVNVTKNKELINKHFSLDASVLYCGVDNVKPRELFPWVSGDIKIVSTGIVYKFRNYENLIKACFELKKIVNTKIVLNIVGNTRNDPEYVTELIGLGKELDVNVNFLGALSEIELQNLYETSHIFSFINVDQSWGLSVFEAASIGLPIILSSSVGATELLSNKKGIHIVDPLDPRKIALEINKIIKDQITYDSESRFASESVKNMTWDSMYSENLKTIFKTLIEK